MKRFRGSILVVLMFQLLPHGALAQPPEGTNATCPSDYQAMTVPDILAQAERLGISEERARAMFESVNKNEDEWICQKKLSGDDTSYNFLDNQAIGKDRP